jgi:DNA-directed RNA polymerase beta' subunit
MRPLHLHQVDPERKAIPCPLVGSAVAEADAFAGTGHGAIVPHNPCLILSLLVGWTPLMLQLHLHQVDPEWKAIPCPLVGSAVAEADAFAGTGHGAIVPHNPCLVLSLLVGWTPLMLPLHLHQVDPKWKAIPCPLVGSAVAEADAFAGTGHGAIVPHNPCLILSLLVGWTPLMLPLHLHPVDPEWKAIPCPLVGSAVAEADAFAGTGHGAIVPHNPCPVMSLMAAITRFSFTFEFRSVGCPITQLVTPAISDIASANLLKYLRFRARYILCSVFM